MIQAPKRTGKASSTPVGLGLGFMSSMIVTVVSSAILAKMIDAENIPESSIGYGVMIILILAAFIGAMVATGRIKRQRLVMAMTSGGIYFLGLLSLTALFFDGQYSGVGVTALLVLCGAGLAAMTGMNRNRVGKRKKLHLPNR